jgi:hypothetical protein
MRIRSEGWSHYIERQIAPRWPAACRSWFPEGSDYSLDWTWLFFQYVFPLDDPRGVAPLVQPAFSEDEWAALDRYLAQARDLAGSTILTARSGYSVDMETMGSEPEIMKTKSARDVTIGFLTMLRQCYSHNELASFTRVAKLVSREMHRAGLDDLQTLMAWRKAHATLRHTHLDHLILVQAAADAHVPQHLGRVQRVASEVCCLARVDDVRDLLRRHNSLGRPAQRHRDLEQHVRRDGGEAPIRRAAMRCPPRAPVRRVRRLAWPDHRTPPARRRLAGTGGP